MIPKTNLFTSQDEISSPLKSMRGSFSNELERKNTKVTKAFEKTQIQVKNQILDDLLQVYSWRSKAQLPIAKVMFYKVIERNPNEPTTTIEVSYESFPLTLSDLNQISLPNILYLLKEASIGFEKLFKVFGSFLISNKMIGVNKNNRCKVWINQNFAINEPIDVEMFKNLSEKNFINQIHTLLQKKTEKSKKTQSLFSQLGKCEKFQDTVQCIEKFSEQFGIQIPQSFKIEEKQERKNDVSKSPLRNPNQLTCNSLIGDKSKQVPRFFNKSNINDPSRETLGASNIHERLEKSRSITKSGIRNRTPLNPNRSQINLHSPYKPTPNTSIKIQRKEDEIDRKSKMDYSFEKTNKSSSPLQNNSKKSNPMIESSNSFKGNEVHKFDEGKSFRTYLKKTTQFNEVIKSDLQTANTNSSGITDVSPRRLLQKKNSLFDADHDMLQSIVLGNEHEKPKNSSFSTADLQHLGKLGKTVVESCMPEDFEN